MSTSSFRFWAAGVVSLVAMFVLLFLIASEVVIRRFVEPVFLFDAHVRYVTRTELPNAVFGDSVAARAFQGQPDFAKLAFQGERPRQILAKARAYFSDRKPGKIVVEAGFHYFDSKENNPDDDHRYEDIFGSLNAGLLRVFRPQHRVALRRYWIALLQEGQLTSKEYINEDGEVRVYGVEEGYRTEAERVDNAKKWMDFYVTDAELVGNRNMDHFRSLLSFLRDRGGDVCVVAFPISPTLQRLAQRTPDYAAMTDAYRRIAHEEHLRFIDMSDQFLDDTIFVDGTHVRFDAAPSVSEAIVDACFGDDRK